MRLIHALAVTGAAALAAACHKPAPPAEPVRAVKTMTVSSSQGQGSYDFAAEVRARVESQLGFRVGGKIIRRTVNLGDTVKQGQLLAQLDPQDLRLGQDAARAALSAAQVNYEQANADYKRYKGLRDQDFISSADLERRETALKAAKAQLDQALAQSSVQGNQAAYASLMADAPGVITSVLAEPGMVVSAGAPVVRLAQDGPRDIVFSVPEDRVALVKPAGGVAREVRVAFWGVQASSVMAKVREVAASADPVTRTFLVKADLDAATSASARLGQTATVTIDGPRASGLVKLPLSALREEQGKSSVWLLDTATMTVRPQLVEVSGADGNQAVVTKGLAEGQTVVTAGVHVLSPNQKVTLYVDPTARPIAPPASAVPVRVQ